MVTYSKLTQEKERQDQEQERKSNLDYLRQLGTAAQKSGGLGRSMNTITIANAVRQDINDGDFSKFFLVFVLAMVKDGFIDFIPFLNLFVGLPISLFLIVSLWRRGRFMKKQIAKRLIAPLLILIFGNLPIIQIFFLETFVVYWIYRKAKKNAEEKEKELKETIAAYA